MTGGDHPTARYVGDPWDQQPQETAFQHARFTAYLEQPAASRTFSAIADQHGLDRTAIGKVAQRWRWRERAALWDAHRTKTRRAAILDRDVDLAEKAWKVAETTVDLLLRNIEQLVAADVMLEPKDFAAFARSAELFRKMALDRPDQLVEISGQGGGPIQVQEYPEFEGLTGEQSKERYAEIARSMLRVVSGGKAS